VGVFIALFLIIFEPFGISNWQTNYKTIKLIGFGSVSFICPLIFKGFCMLFFSNSWLDDWKVWKEILMITSMMLLIALGNLFFSFLIGISNFGLLEFITVTVCTFLVGLFPIVFSVAFKYHKFLTLNKRDAELMEQEIIKRDLVKDQTISFVANNKFILLAENNKDTFELKAESLLYIESINNYCELVVYENNTIKKQLIRSTLKRIESQIVDPSLVRCHRAFIVNLQLVSHIEGNAQGYRISLKGSEKIIPVSRQYGKTILHQLKSNLEVYLSQK
jgi:hypothetical protein